MSSLKRSAQKRWAIVPAVSVALAVAFTPLAQAQYRFYPHAGYGHGWGGYHYGGYGHWHGGYGHWHGGSYGYGWGGAAVAGLAIGALAGALMAHNDYGYGYGYGPYRPLCYDPGTDVYVRCLPGPVVSHPYAHGYGYPGVYDEGSEIALYRFYNRK